MTGYSLADIGCAAASTLVRHHLRAVDDAVRPSTPVLLGLRPLTLQGHTKR
ncbi:hypothetical protein [Rhodococcus qingshengii]|uniref:hypothetical protein n=1 Tax=Rhodococcus erythropolis group TaxID=2840174 RepID=UPI001AE0E412|nr:hypothetical protein [Rhodococcus qingshengii]